MGLRELALAEWRVKELEDEKYALERAEQQKKNDWDRARKWLGMEPDKVDGDSFWFEGLHFRHHYSGYASYMQIVLCDQCNIARSVGEYKPIKPEDIGRELAWFEKQNHKCPDPEAVELETSQQEQPPTAEQELFQAIRRVVYENSCQGCGGY